MTLEEGVDVVNENTFQSTCHIRGMTIAPEIGSMRLKISIHMPHTWHDSNDNGCGTL